MLGTRLARDRRPWRNYLLTIAAFAVCAIAPTAASAVETGVEPNEAVLPLTAAECQGTKVVAYLVRGSDENPGVNNYFEGVGTQMLPIYRALKQLYTYGAVPTPLPAEPVSSWFDSTRVPGLKLVTNRGPRTIPRDAQNRQEYRGVEDPASRRADPQLGYRAIGVDLTVFQDPASNTGAYVAGLLEEYKSSMLQGTAAAVWDLNRILDNCPNATLVVMGYSQGAEILRRAMADSALAERVRTRTAKTAAFLFGDVRWHENEPNVKYVGGTAGNTRGLMNSIQSGGYNGVWGSGPQQVLTALGPVPQFKPEWNVTTYCHAADVACQGAGDVNQHTNYDVTDAVGASARMAQFIYEFGGSSKLDIASNRQAVTVSTTSTRSCIKYLNAWYVPTSISMRVSIIGDPGQANQVRGSWPGFGDGGGYLVSDLTLPADPLRPLVNPDPTGNPDPTNRVDGMLTRSAGVLAKAPGATLVSAPDGSSVTRLHAIAIC